MAQVVVDFVDAVVDEDGFVDVGRAEVILRIGIGLVDTDGRVKVVFAGLHNVQRFEGIPLSAIVAGLRKCRAA